MLDVSFISEERWIYIAGEDSFYKPDEFVDLVKEYQLFRSGKIFKVSEDTQYGIDNDPLELIFQWDDLFGITVIVPDKTDIEIAESTLKELCSMINHKKQ